MRVTRSPEADIRIPQSGTLRTPAALRIGWRWLRAQLGHPPVGYLVLFLNSKCDQNCRHCFVRPESDRHLLTPPELSRIGSQLRGLLQLTITGGEPTLRPDFVPAVQAIAESSGVPSLSIHSNGLNSDLVEEIAGDLLRTLPRQTISWRISLDGVGTLHDQIRRRPGSWEKTLLSLRVLSRMRASHTNLRFYVDTCVSARNETRLEELGAFLATTFPRLDGWELLRLRGEPRDPAAHPATKSYARALKALANTDHCWTDSGLLNRATEIAQREVYRRVLHTLKGGVGVRGCVAGERFLVIGPTGKVDSCETLGNRGDMGDLRAFDCDLRSLLAAEAARSRIRRIRAGECAAGCSEECPALATVALRGGQFAAAIFRSLTRKTAE